METSYLSRKDWSTLDILLGKHGFGGYYDLVEVLKQIANNLGMGNTGVDTDEVKSLPEIVKLLLDWSNRLSFQDGFTDLAIKASDEKEAGK